MRQPDRARDRTLHIRRHAVCCDGALRRVSVASARRYRPIRLGHRSWRSNRVSWRSVPGHKGALGGNDKPRVTVDRTRAYKLRATALHYFENQGAIPPIVVIEQMTVTPMQRDRQTVTPGAERQFVQHDFAF